MIDLSWSRRENGGRTCVPWGDEFASDLGERVDRISSVEARPRRLLYSYI